MSDRATGLVLDVRVHGGTDAQGEVRVSGEFDRLQNRHFDDMTRSLNTELSHFTVDLRHTTIIDSAALGSLVRLRQALDENGCELTTIVSRPFQETVMRIGGLFDHLGVRVEPMDD